MSPVRARSLAPYSPPSRTMLWRSGAAGQRGGALIVKTSLPWLPHHAASAVPNTLARPRGAGFPVVPLAAWRQRSERACVFSSRISRRRPLFRAQRLRPRPCIPRKFPERRAVALRGRLLLGSRRPHLSRASLRDRPARRILRRARFLALRSARQFSADPGALAGPRDQPAVMVAQRRMVCVSAVPFPGRLALALQRPDRGSLLFCAVAGTRHPHRCLFRRAARDRRRLGRARARAAGIRGRRHDLSRLPRPRCRAPLAQRCGVPRGRPGARPPSRVRAERRRHRRPIPPPPPRARYHPPAPRPPPPPPSPTPP